MRISYRAPVWSLIGVSTKVCSQLVVLVEWLSLHPFTSVPAADNVHGRVDVIVIDVRHERLLVRIHAATPLPVAY